MLNCSRFLLIILLLAGVCAAADLPAMPSAVQVQRAGKITAALDLADAAKTNRVRDIIARQYTDLSRIHDVRDAALQAANELAATDRTGAEAATRQARIAAEADQTRLHPQYLARLAAELTPAQIEQVKDGMTYGVVPLTFRVYQELLPDLTPEQKSQILAWLTEAREQAMDASTSDEKHAWFGKYKGRINNYLSQAGIDMKQAEKDMLARKKSATK